MDAKHFDRLVKGVPSIRATELAEPDVSAIREAAQLSQSQFARLIGVRPLHVAELGTASNAVDRPGTGAVEDRGFEPEVGD
jgi:hypothetical protein